MITKSQKQDKKFIQFFDGMIPQVSTKYLMDVTTFSQNVFYQINKK